MPAAFGMAVLALLGALGLLLAGVAQVRAGLIWTSLGLCVLVLAVAVVGLARPRQRQRRRR